MIISQPDDQEGANPNLSSPFLPKVSPVPSFLSTRSFPIAFKVLAYVVE